MTNENIIEIKKQQKGWFGKGFLFLTLMLVSLYISLMPLISAFANKNSSIFYVVGFSLFIIFTFAFVLNIYKTCKPDNALVLSAVNSTVISISELFIYFSPLSPLVELQTV